MRSLLLALLALTTLPAFAAKNVPPPKTCTPQVNQSLQTLIASGTTKDVDNIMVCGTAVGKTVLQSGGANGAHHIITLAVTLPNKRAIKVQVVINDSLDGVITASNGDKVAAYGQGYINHGQSQAGVHDVHCSTHPTADNGWVVINGKTVTPACH